MKRFLLKWCIFFAIIFSVAGYYEIAVKRNVSGDLGTLGHIPFGLEYDRSVQALDEPPTLYSLTSVDNASAYPLLLIGDSFCEQGHGLSHFISKEVGDTVHTIRDRGTDSNSDYMPVNTLLYGLNNGCFRPEQVIILETVERSMAHRFVNINSEKPGEADEPQQASNSQKFGLPSLNDILTWLRIEEGYNTPVKRQKLVRPMFTHRKYASDLFYYQDDHVACNVPQELIDSAATNLNKLMHLAEEQGVVLYLLIAPDKYEMHRPYFVDQDAPMPNMLTILDKVESNRIINARDTLAPLLEQGEMDMWRVNDSHWGVKATQYIGKKIADRLKADSVLHATSRH